MERFLHLIKQKINGQADSREQEELIALLKINKELEQVYNTLFSPLENNLPDDEAIEKAYLKQLQKIKQSGHRPILST